MIKWSHKDEFKPYLKVAKNSNGKRFVISDIHGFYATFRELLLKINFTRQDQLFLLGDFIDKGKKGKEVVDFVIELIENGYSIYPLRGNHEDMVLKSHYRKQGIATLVLPVLSKTRGIRDKERNLYPKYLEFFEKLPYYYELDDFFLVHAGFDFSKAEPFLDFTSMLWMTEVSIDDNYLKGKTVIHGHTKKKIEYIKESVARKDRIIGLDNATMIKNNHYGNLVCLDMDNYKLFIQPAIDEK